MARASELLTGNIVNKNGLITDAQGNHILVRDYFFGSPFSTDDGDHSVDSNTQYPLAKHSGTLDLDSDGKVIVNKDGMYAVGWCFEIKGDKDTRAGIKIYFGNSYKRNIENAEGDNWISASGMLVAKLNAGDKIWFETESFTNGHIYSGKNSQFSVVQVGD